MRPSVIVGKPEAFGLAKKVFLAFTTRMSLTEESRSCAITGFPTEVLAERAAKATRELEFGDALFSN
jgi:hypothetical protein